MSSFCVIVLIDAVYSALKNVKTMAFTVYEGGDCLNKDGDKEESKKKAAWNGQKINKINWLDQYRPKSKN